VSIIGTVRTLTVMRGLTLDELTGTAAL